MNAQLKAKIPVMVRLISPPWRARLYGALGNYVEQMRPIAKKKTGKTASGTKKTDEEELPYARLPRLLKKEAF